MPYTVHSKKFLLLEGIKKEHIFVTGSPMAEVLNHYKEKIDNSNILKKLEIEKGKYILVSTHREENIDLENNFLSLMDALNTVAEEFKLPIIFSTHPRTSKMLEIKNITLNPLIKNLKPFGFFDYNHLQKNSFCVLSDSGTLSEESSILNFPAVLIRTSTERPEVIEKGTIIIGGIKKDSIIQSIYIVTNSHNNEPIIPKDYYDKNISIKVVKIIQSYKDIINKNVWNK
jgi:UDP-N-acetylglucosamine 2-epimerase (non-hydrolysing)